jgi:membrane protein DedA with SNARE-associated domain
LPLPIFATYAYLGGLLWSGSFISIGYVLGDEWAQMSASIQRYLLLGAGIATVMIVIGFLLMRRRQRKHHLQAI